METKTAKKEIKQLDYSKKERLIMALLTSLVPSFIFFLYGPVDIYANNIKEYVFCFYDFIGAQLLCFAVCFALLSLCFYLAKSYLLNALTAMVVSIFVSSFIDVNFINKIEYTSGDVSKLNVVHTVAFYALYVICFIAFEILAFKLKKRWKSVLVFLCVLLFGMNAAALTTDIISHQLYNDNEIGIESVLSNKDLFKASDKENIIVILFDRFDSDYYEEVVKDSPGYFEDMEGFTLFNRATSEYSRSFPSLTGIITGNDYLLEESPTEYFDKAYRESKVLKDLKDNGYSINLYTDRYYTYSDAECFGGYADNVQPVDRSLSDVDTTEICVYLTMLSFERNFSVMLTEDDPFFGAVNETIGRSALGCKDGVFQDNDGEFYKELKKNGLSPTGKDKNYIFLYLHGSHYPHHLDENCEESENATVVSQTKGAFKIVFDYLDELKKLGVYDNSTVIVTADHGYAITDAKVYDDSFVKSGISICMFVKPRGADNKKLIVSDAQVSLDNLIPTYVKDAKLKTENDYGKTVFDIKSGENVTRTLYHQTYTDSGKTNFNKFEITGDAENFDNWKLVETIESEYHWY